MGERTGANGGKKDLLGVGDDRVRDGTDEFQPQQKTSLGPWASFDKYCSCCALLG